jgi:hypothetical protein
VVSGYRIVGERWGAPTTGKRSDVEHLVRRVVAAAIAR